MGKTSIIIDVRGAETDKPGEIREKLTEGKSSTTSSDANT